MCQRQHARRKYATKRHLRKREQRTMKSRVVGAGHARGLWHRGNTVIAGMALLPQDHVPPRQGLSYKLVWQLFFWSAGGTGRQGRVQKRTAYRPSGCNAVLGWLGARRGNVELAHAGIEGGWVKPEQFGGAALALDSAMGRLEGGQDVPPFRFRQGQRRYILC